MKNIEEFKTLTKPKMVVIIIETMVQQGWEISNFVYGFKAYTKSELINNYKRLIDYGKIN